MQFHSNILLLSSCRHIELFLAAFVLCLLELFISLLAFSQIPRYMEQCVVTPSTLSSCSLFLFHLSVPISSQHPFYSAFTQVVFLRIDSSIFSVTNRKGGFFGAITHQYSLLSFHSSFTFFPFSNPLPIICPISLFWFSSALVLLFPSDVGFLDSCWHLVVVPFLPFLPARLRWKTGALVEVLLWLLAEAVSQGAPSACLSCLSVPGPWPLTPTPLASQSCCQFTGHMCQASSPYLRPRSCLGVTVPATARAPWKRGCRQLFSSPERHRGRLDKKKWWK